MDTKTMGWIQLAGGAIALWGIWRLKLGLAIAALAVVLLVMGYHHVTVKGRRR